MHMATHHYSNERTFTDNQEQLIKRRYLRGESINDLYKSLHAGEKAVRNALRRTNTRKRTKSEAIGLYYQTPDGIKKGERHSNKVRRYAVNEKFFTHLNPVSAYVLGFWVADGHAEHKRGQHSIDFSQMEEGILIKIKKAMSATHPVSKKPKGYRLLISSRHLIADMQKISTFDIRNQKSKNASYPVIPSGLDRHFIRGVFDGDGGISIKGKTTKYPQAQLSFTGTEKLNHAIQEKLVEHGVIKKRTKIFLVSTFSKLFYSGTKNVLHILGWLYEDAELFLDRKKNTYEQLKSWRDKNERMV